MLMKPARMDREEILRRKKADFRRNTAVLQKDTTDFWRKISTRHRCRVCSAFPYKKRPRPNEQSRFSYKFCQTGRFIFGRGKIGPRSGPP